MGHLVVCIRQYLLYAIERAEDEIKWYKWFYILLINNLEEKPFGDRKQKKTFEEDNRRDLREQYRPLNNKS